jgi:hypothetical protein
MLTWAGDLLVSVYLLLLFFFTWGLGLGQDCGAGSDAGQLAVIPASVAAMPAAEAAEAKGAL